MWCRALQAATAVAVVGQDYLSSVQRGMPQPPPVVLRKLFTQLGRCAALLCVRADPSREGLVPPRMPSSVTNGRLLRRACAHKPCLILIPHFVFGGCNESE